MWRTHAKKLEYLSLDFQSARPESVRGCPVESRCMLQPFKPAAGLPCFLLAVVNGAQNRLIPTSGILLFPPTQGLLPSLGPNRASPPPEKGKDGQSPTMRPEHPINFQPQRSTTKRAFLFSKENTFELPVSDLGKIVYCLVSCFK
jgi:hypothetical protein